ncbi:PI-PLC X domain-containing protein 3-like [Amblyraja radiata]|uniref:PI-PLC X domain-containing protein 3-like n=1 Tax=Amblyraja radiata TaxID=386614 RepID=UPI001402C56A|nr:PI-PLC X domain-containing protein 3-like [Amblyraja radiata]
MMRWGDPVGDVHGGGKDRAVSRLRADGISRSRSAPLPSASSLLPVPPARLPARPQFVGSERMAAVRVAERRSGAVRPAPSPGTPHADWMGSLPRSLCALPLANLAVPGSHDSFSFWIDENSPVGLDQPVVVRQLAGIFRSLWKKTMKKWSVTQSLNFIEQLEAGIRYFDLRISRKPGEENELYFIHGLFGSKVYDGLMEINNFLKSHSKEVIFLDFNHYYAMEDINHEYLIEMLKEIFGSRLCRANLVEEITLQYLWERKYQVLVFYHHPMAYSFPFLWPGHQIPAPWANTNDAQKLVQFLETTLSERARRRTFHVSQAILTPHAKTVIQGMIVGLRDSLVARNLPVIMNWVKCQKPGVNGVNIITSDFVELVDFATTVIKLNYLLLHDKTKREQV